MSNIRDTLHICNNCNNNRPVFVTEHESITETAVLIPCEVGVWDIDVGPDRLAAGELPGNGWPLAAIASISACVIILALSGFDHADSRVRAL